MRLKGRDAELPPPTIVVSTVSITIIGSAVSIPIIRSVVMSAIAVAIIRPVVVAGPALGIIAAARPDTAVTRGERVSWADRNRSGGARRRSAQHRWGRKRGCRARWVRSRYRNDLRVDRDGPDQRKDEGENADLQRDERPLLQWVLGPR